MIFFGIYPYLKIKNCKLKIIYCDTINRCPVVELGIARDTVHKNNTKFTTGLSGSVK
jgi:hypothetical protein